MLQWGVGLFILGGFVDILIGAATPIVTRVGGLLPSNTFWMTRAADEVLFGHAPSQIILDQPAAGLLYRLAIDLIGGLILVFGVFQVALAWFALRRGEWWALWALVVGDLLFVYAWSWVVQVYIKRGAPLTFFSLPPNLWIPAILLIPAAVSSFLGLRSTM